MSKEPNWTLIFSSIVLTAASTLTAAASEYRGANDLEILHLAKYFSLKIAINALWKSES